MIVNPQHACAARVTVLVCLFVCLSTTILALQATRRLMSETNSFGATRARKKCGDFAETTAFEHRCSEAIISMVREIQFQ